MLPLTQRVMDGNHRHVAVHLGIRQNLVQRKLLTAVFHASPSSLFREFPMLAEHVPDDLGPMWLA